MHLVLVLHRELASNLATPTIIADERGRGRRLERGRVLASAARSGATAGNGREAVARDHAVVVEAH